jgi:hypothetical protein
MSIRIVTWGILAIGVLFSLYATELTEQKWDHLRVTFWWLGGFIVAYAIDRVDSARFFMGKEKE